VSEVDAAKTRSRSLVSVWRLISLLLLVAVFYYVGKQLGRDFKELKAQQVRVEVDWFYLAGGLICLLGARLSNAVNTWLILRSMGVQLPLWRVVAVIWVSSLGRYIPGKVAVVAGSMTLLMKMGARFSAAGAGLILSTAMMILLGMIGAIPLLLSPRLMAQMPRGTNIALVMAAGIAALCLYPPIFLALCNVGLGILKKPKLPLTLRRGPFWGAVGIGLLRIMFVSMSLWLVARALAPLEARTIITAIGTASLASVLGFLAVFAPAGLGVHEMVYLIALKPMMGAPVAILVLMFRVLQVLMDLVVAGIGAMIMRKNTELRIHDSEEDPHPALSQSTGRG
jgi:uncharacterized membrane protein YbhN (UPF0104 family)